MTDIPWSDDAVVGWSGYDHRWHAFLRTPGYAMRLVLSGPEYGCCGQEISDCLTAMVDGLRAACAESEETRLEREMRERYLDRFRVELRKPMYFAWVGYGEPDYEHPDESVYVYRPTKLAALRALAAATKALDEVG